MYTAVGFPFCRYSKTSLNIGLEYIEQYRQLVVYATSLDSTWEKKISIGPNDHDLIFKYLLDSPVNQTWPHYKLIQMLESDSVSNLNSSFHQIGPLYPSALTVLWFFISLNKWCYLLVPERVVIQRGQAVVDGSCAVLTHRLFGRLDIHITVF